MFFLFCVCAQRHERLRPVCCPETTELLRFSKWYILDRTASGLEPGENHFTSDPSFIQELLFLNKSVKGKKEEKYGKQSRRNVEFVLLYFSSLSRAQQRDSWAKFTAGLLLLLLLLLRQPRDSLQDYCHRRRFGIGKKKEGGERGGKTRGYHEACRLTFFPFSSQAEENREIPQQYEETSNHSNSYFSFLARDASLGRREGKRKGLRIISGLLKHDKEKQTK